MAEPELEPSRFSRRIGPYIGPVLRDSSAIAVPQFLGLALTFVVSVALARWLGAAEFGSYNYIASWVGMLALLGVFGADTMLARDVSAYGATSAWRAIRGAIRWGFGASFIASVLLGLGMFAASSRLSGDTVLPAALWALGALLLPLTTMLRVQQGVLRGLRRLAQSQIGEAIVQPAVLLVVAIAIIGVGERTAERALIAHLSGVAVGLIFGAAMLHRAMPNPARAAVPSYESRRWFSTASRLFAISAFAALSGRIDVVLLGALGSPAAVGPYSAAVRGASLIPIALNITVIAMTPTLAASFAAGDRDGLQRIVRRMAQLAALGGLPVAIAMLLGGQWFLRLFGRDFVVATQALRILSIGQLVNVLTGPAATVLVVCGRETDAVVGVALGALTSGAICAALVPRLGMTGAAIGAAAALALWNALLCWYVLRRTHIVPTVWSMVGHRTDR